MKKRVIDLTAEELDRLAGEAWSKAAEEALAKGAAVVGREGDQIVKTYPDGRVEVLKQALPLVEAPASATVARKVSPARRTA
jgi:hypothetical protein